MENALRIINKMQAEGLFVSYSIGGGISKDNTMADNRDVAIYYNSEIVADVFKKKEEFHVNRHVCRSGKK